MMASVLVRLPSVFKDVEKFSNISPTSEASQKFIDEFYTDENNPYLYDADSYFYSKQVVDLIKEPSVFSNFGKYNLLSFITATTYKLLNPLTGISIETLICYIGPIIFSLSCIPAYIFIKKKSNRIGGFTAALLLGISPILVSFSIAMRFDTDILLTLLPTTMICAFILAIEAKSTKKSILGLAIATFSFFLLTLTWESCLVYALIAFLISFIVLLSSLIKDHFKLKTSLSRKELKVALIFPIILVAISFIMHDHIISILGTAALTINGTSGDFPSPGSFVSELSCCPLYSGGILDIFNVANCGVVNLLGSFTLITAVAIFIVLITRKNFAYLKNQHQKQNPLFLTSTVLIIWLLVGIISSSFGMRFIKNAAIPAALLAGLAVGMLYTKLHTSTRDKIIVLLCWILICIPSFRSYALTKATIPSVNDSLTKVTSYINNNFDSDYTIASWWDYGYFYEYKTDLNVILDGGTYDSHAYYWVASAFLTEDEVLSAKIFKMLANSNLKAPEFAKSIVGNYAKSAKILKQILPLSKDKAKNILISDYGFTADQANTLLNFTHQDSKVVVLVNKEMLSLVESSITYFGCWSFNDEFPSTEPACQEQEDYSSSMIYRLYREKTDSDVFKHSIKITDPAKSLSTNIWTIKNYQGSGEF